MLTARLHACCRIPKTMTILLHLIHAAKTVRPLYEAAFRDQGLAVDIVTVLPPAAAGGALSSAYAELAVSWGLEGLTPTEGLLRDYPGEKGSYQGWFLAAWSAGYKLIERALDARDAHLIDGVVMLDSGHAAFDADHTASDKQLEGFVRHAKRAIETKALLHVAFTDVSTPQKGAGAYASTTQWAAELLRLAAPELLVPAAPNYSGHGLLHVQAFDEEPPARARQEHIGALMAWGAGFTAKAIKTWVDRDESAPPPRAQQTLGERALAIAIGELGVSEEPIGSNTGVKVREYLLGCVRGGKPLRLAVAPWCAAFVGWQDAIARLRAQSASDYSEPPCRWRAAVAELVADAREAGAWQPVGDYVPAPGDLAVFRRNGQDPTKGGEGHVARVETSPDVHGFYTTIGGNEDHRVARTKRTVKDPELLGWIRYPRPTPDVPSTEDIARGAVAAGLDRAAREALGDT